MATTTPAEKEPGVNKLLELLDAKYRVARSDLNTLLAVPRKGSNVGITLSSEAWRHIMVKTWRDKTGRVATSSMLEQAIAAMKAEAYTQLSEPTYLRVAPHPKTNLGCLINLSIPTGELVEVTETGWKIIPACTYDVVFEQTNATLPLATPTKGMSFDAFRNLLNLSDADWQLLKAVLVAFYFPNAISPALGIMGQQGTAKSTITSMLVRLIDPSVLESRSLPRDEEQAMVTSAASQAVAFDNISYIPKGMSDTLARLVTGTGYGARQFYTNTDLSIIKLRRFIILNGIDFGNLRGDLANRLAPLELEPIPASRRRSETDLEAQFLAVLPALFGGLLDEVAIAYRHLEHAKHEQLELPRLAEFGNICRALDLAHDTDSLGVFKQRQTELAGTVIEGSTLATQLHLFMQQRTVWQGSTSDLLEELTKGVEKTREWPTTSSALGRQLKRLAPDLATTYGITITHGRARTGSVITLSKTVPDVPDDPITDQSGTENVHSTSENVQWSPTNDTSSASLWAEDMHVDGEPEPPPRAG